MMCPSTPTSDALSEWRLRSQLGLQGVRAVAVLAVFAFHVGRLDGGWLGVEAFFVLSGYLITALLWMSFAREASVWWASKSAGSRD